MPFFVWTVITVNWRRFELVVGRRFAGRVAERDTTFKKIRKRRKKYSRARASDYDDPSRPYRASAHVLHGASREAHGTGGVTAPPSQYVGRGRGIRFHRPTRGGTRRCGARGGGQGHAAGRRGETRRCVARGGGQGYGTGRRGGGDERGRVLRPSLLARH